jgi:tetratricopeptide (TPR) repeat protein
MEDPEKKANKLLKEATQFLENKQYSKSLKLSEESIELDSKNAQLHNFQGIVFAEKGEYEEALKAFEKAIELDPQRAGTHSTKGGVFYKQGEYEKALEAYDCAIELDPKNAVWHYEKGQVFFGQGEYEKALEAYDCAIELDPKNAVWHYEKGRVFFGQGEYEKALEAYDCAIELDPKNACPHHAKGWALYKLGRHRDALAAYERAIVLDPKDPVCWNGKGGPLKELGRYKDAMEACEKAIDLDPELASPWSNLCKLSNAAPEIQLGYSLTALWSRHFYCCKGKKEIRDYLEVYDTAPLPFWVQDFFENSPVFWDQSIYKEIQREYGTAIRLYRFLFNTEEDFLQNETGEYLIILDYLFGNPIRANECLDGLLWRDKSPSLRAHYLKLMTLESLCFSPNIFPNNKFCDTYDNSLGWAIDSVKTSVSGYRAPEAAYYAAWIQILDTEEATALELLAEYREAQFQPILFLGVWLAYRTESEQLDMWLKALEFAQATSDGPVDIFSAYVCKPISKKPEALKELLDIAAYELELESVLHELMEVPAVQEYLISLPSNLRRIRDHLQAGPFDNSFEQTLDKYETLRRKALLEDAEITEEYTTKWLKEMDIQLAGSSAEELEASLAKWIKDNKITEKIKGKPNLKRIIAYLFLESRLYPEASSTLLAYLQSKKIFEQGDGNLDWILEELPKVGLSAVVGFLTQSLGAGVVTLILSVGVEAIPAEGFARIIREIRTRYEGDVLPFPEYPEFKELFEREIKR